MKRSKYWIMTATLRTGYVRKDRAVKAKRYYIQARPLWTDGYESIMDSIQR